MAIVDRHGLPLAVSAHAANHHEVTLVQLSFEFYMIEAKPENLIGDRAYDSDTLDAQLREQGAEMIAPHRSNRVKRVSRDGRRLRRYATPLDRRALLCVDSMASSITGSLGILPSQLPRFCTARGNLHHAEAILR